MDANAYPGLNLTGLSVAQATAQRARYMAALQKAERSFPELHVRVSATPVGMRLVASIYRPTGRFQQKVDIIAEAVWTPKVVTERLVVEWAQRALTQWLEENPEPLRVAPPPPEMAAPSPGDI